MTDDVLDALDSVCRIGDAGAIASAVGAMSEAEAKGALLRIALTRRHGKPAGSWLIEHGTQVTLEDQDSIGTILRYKGAAPVFVPDTRVPWWPRTNKDSK